MQHLNELILFHKLRMLQLSSCYNLVDPSERSRSVSDLEKLFFRITGYVKPDFFIEAGAKNAQVSARARRHLPDSSLVAFEANPHSYEKFQHAAHIADAKINYIHAALASEVGEIEFSLQLETDGVLNSETRGNGSILIPTSDNVKLATHKVKATTLDTYFAEEDIRLGFIWVDVEGAQNVVLPGGDKILRNNVGAVFIEIEDREIWTGQWLSTDVHQFMMERGFVPIARDFQSRYQYNVVYLKAHIFEIDDVNFCLQMHYSHSATGRK